MGYCSQLYPNEVVINDSTPEEVTHGDGRGLLMELRPRNGYAGLAASFPQSLMLPGVDDMGALQAMIQEKEERKTRQSDIITLSGLPHKDQARTNYCFPAGTMIRMEDGTHKPIEAVSLLDRVLTAEGNVSRVLKSCVHDISEPLYRLLLWGHKGLRATGDHPVLTKRGYVPLKKIRIGDKVAIPKYAPATTKNIITGDYLYEKNRVAQAKHKYRTYNYASAKGSSYSASIPGKSSVTLTRHPVPDVIEMTPDLGRVFGLYAAEGHTGNCCVCWSFNANEKDTLAAECAAKIKSSLGCEPHVRVRKTVCQVIVYGANWAKLFDALFGRGSDLKGLSADIASGPKDFLEQLLSGWIDGDRKKGDSAVTVSRRLSLNMFDIANALGLRPTISTHQNAKVGRDGISRKHSWVVGWADKVNHATEQDDRHLWRSVRGIEQEEFAGQVFNIEVEGDSSYVAEGIGVHNCWINAPVYAFECARVLQGLPMVILSPASVGAPVKGFRNIGGWGGEGLEYMIENGVVPVSRWPANAIDRTYYNETNKGIALNYRPTEWVELQPRNMSQVFSLLLQGFAVAGGFSWWSHEVTLCDVVWLDGRPCIRFRNSWANFGDNGYSILQGDRMKPDDAVAPIIALAA